MSETAIEVFEHHYENDTLVGITYPGEKVWPVATVAMFLGYDDRGERLQRNIKGPWREEFEADVDIVTVRGAEAAAVAKQFAPALRAGAKPGAAGRRTGANYRPDRVRKLTLLRESGVNLVFLLSEMPRARQKRRWFAREVMPQLNRDQRYDPRRAVVGGKLVDATATAAESANALADLRYAMELAASGSSPLAIGLALEVAEMSTGRDLSPYKSTLIANSSGHEQSRFAVSPHALALRAARTYESMRVAIVDTLTKGPGRTRKSLEKALGIHADNHFLFLYVVRMMVLTGELVDSKSRGRAGLLSLAPEQLGLAISERERA